MKIEAQRVAGGYLLVLPLGPSVNQRTMPVRTKWAPIQRLTPAARNYIGSVGTALKYWAKSVRWKPIDYYTFVDFWFILPRVGTDSHNYYKMPCDAMEAGGLFKNDCFILTRTGGVFHDTKAPAVIVMIRSRP